EANARLLLGDPEGAAAPTDETLAVGRAQAASSLVQGLGARARAEAMAGDWSAAAAAVDEAVGVADAHWLDDRPAYGPVRATMSLVHARTGRCTTAVAARAPALALVERLDDVTPFIS